MLESPGRRETEEAVARTPCRSWRRSGMVQTKVQPTLYFEDVNVGDEVPPYRHKAGYLELNRFAGANEELIPIHMDPEASQKSGLPGVITMGNLKVAYIVNMLEDWAGPESWLRKLTVQFRGMDVVNQTLVAKGTVTGKRVENGENWVELDVWVEDEDQGGRKNTPGTAVVILPSRGG
jgi:acyl dehydratase